MIKVKPLEWSDPTPPNQVCSYDHVIAKGAWIYSIEWKSWKNVRGYVVYRDGEFLSADANTLDEAKAIAENDYDRLVRSALFNEGPGENKPVPPPEHQRYREIAIDNAIRYALHHSPLTEIQFEERGEYVVEIHELESVKPFVVALLRDLGVSP